VKRDIGYEFKQQLMAGKKVFGPLMGPGNDTAPTVAALKEFGYDFFMIDNEHSMVGKETIYEYIRLSREYELPVLMRPEETLATINAYLDSGIQGLMIPQVDTIEQAAHAVDRTYFPPVGHRGYGLGMNPYLLDGMDLATTPLLTLFEYVNHNMVLFPQTESLLAITNLPQTLRLEGITGTVVGTNDLALDIGGIKPGMLRTEVNTQPFIEEKLLQVANICKQAGKVAGMGGFSPKGYARWAREGFQFFNLGYIRDNNVEQFRSVLQEARDLIG
jgi:4-hydroxy-2-oxoheptanedioate aldolase